MSAANDATQPSKVPSWNAEALTQGGQVARILLDGVEFTLRITRAGKLLLTK